MKERPILFSGEMVCAILEGRKTQTRRILHQPRRKDGVKLLPELLKDIGVGHACPHGAVGDRLWVRETWDLHILEGESLPSLLLMADSTAIPTMRAEAWKLRRSDNSHKWRPSIFMPRWASRITLEITGVRVERVQEISEADCCRETGAPLKWEGEGPEPYPRNMRAFFRALWNSINGKRGYGWDVNPWVWVIEFKKLEVAPCPA